MDVAAANRVYPVRHIPKLEGRSDSAHSIDAMSQAGRGLTADDVRNAAFSKPPIGKRGYDKKSVDDFLQLAARRLDGRGHLGADDVHAISFPKPPTFQRGYHEDEVDEFLQQVEAAIAALGARS